MRYQVRHGRLPNGLRFYTQYDWHTTNEIATIAIKAGSLHDPPHRRGLAHLTEHVLFMSNFRKDEENLDPFFVRTLGGWDNGAYNVSTDHTTTCYGPDDTLRKNHNRKAFSVFASMVKDGVQIGTPKQELVSEQAAILQEYCEGKDTLSEDMPESLYGLLYPKSSPSHNTILGSMSEVHQATLRDVRRFIQQYYVPANTVVVFFGPKHEEVRRIVTHELGDWGADWKAGRNKEAKCPRMTGKNGFKPLVKPIFSHRQRKGISQYNVVIGYPTESYMSNDTEALKILASILGDRMYKHLRHNNFEYGKGIYHPGVDTEFTTAHGMIYLHFSTTNRQFANHGVGMFVMECRRLSRELIPRTELEARILYMHDYEFIEPFSTLTGELAVNVINAVSCGDTKLTKFHARGKKLKSFLNRGGREKLREVASKYLSGHNATVLFEPK